MKYLYEIKLIDYINEKLKSTKRPKFKSHTLQESILINFKEFTGLNKPPKKLKSELGNFYGSLIRFIENN